METNPNIIRLLEMLESPEAYSEQEIRDIINKDEETREAYRLMVAVRQGYAHKTEKPTDPQALLYWHSLRFGCGLCRYPHRAAVPEAGDPTDGASG